jgi:hypothetical protein
MHLHAYALPVKKPRKKNEEKKTYMRNDRVAFKDAHVLGAMAPFDNRGLFEESRGVELASAANEEGSRGDSP